MKFNKDFIQSVKDNNPIEEVCQQWCEQEGAPFERRGSQIFCHHFVHESSSKKSMWVTPATQSFYCFNCNIGGDVITLTQSFMFGASYDARNMEQFSKAISWLADRVGLAYEGEAEIDDEYIELRIIYNIYNDFIEYSRKNSFNILKPERTDKIVNMIAERYPLNDETIRNFRICFFDGKWTKPFYKKLLEKYSEEELLGSGLFIKDKKGNINSTFINRILFPYIQSGDVVYIIGRETPESGEYVLNADGESVWKNFDYGGKFKKLPIHSENPEDINHQVSPKVRNDYVFGCDSIRRGEDLIITEGIGDCLVLLQQGYKAISPVTTRFKNEMLEPVAKKLMYVRQIYIANDNELSEAGLQGATRMYNFFLGKGLDAKIVQLPLPEGQTKIDVADYFRNNDRESFQVLLDNSKSLVEIEIEKLTPSSHRLDVQKVWDKVMNMNSFDRDTYMDLVAKRVGKKVKALKDMFSNGRQKALTEDLKFDTHKVIIPALDFDQDEYGNKSMNTVIHIPSEVKDPETGVTERINRPFLIKVETAIDGTRTQTIRNLVNEPLSENEMARIPDDQIFFNRWRLDQNFPFSAYVFLKSNTLPKVEVDAVFHKIYKIFDDYFWYPHDQEKLIQTIYIFMTYFFQLFRAVPGLHLTGPRNSGKSNAMDVHKNLCFNATMFLNVTEAHLFRSAHADRATFIIDEAETYTGDGSEKYADILGILRARYKKGVMVPRIAKDMGMKREYFDPYGPTILGSINPLQDVFASRTIPIECLTKSVKDKTIRNYSDEEYILTPMYADIRDKLYFLLLTEYSNVWACYDMTMADPNIAHISNREREKWVPLLTIARWIDMSSKHTTKSLYEQLIDIQKHKEQIRREYEITSSIELILLKFIQDILVNARNHAMKVENIGDTGIGVKADLFYAKVNSVLRANQIIKTHDMISANIIDNILRKTNVWRLGDGIPKQGMFVIDTVRLQEAINRLQAG